MNIDEIIDLEVGVTEINSYLATVVKINKETSVKTKGAGYISFPVADFLTLGLGNIFTEKIKNTEVYLKKKDTGLDIYYDLPCCDFIGVEGQEITVIESIGYPLMLINNSMKQRTICPHPIISKLIKDSKMTGLEKTGAVVFYGLGFLVARGRTEPAKKKIKKLLDFLNNIPIEEVSEIEHQDIKVSTNNLDKLEKLFNLKEKGIITEEEFNQQKQQLLQQ